MEKTKIKKLLIGEAALLIVLLAAAIFARFVILRPSAEAPQTEPEQTTALDSAVEVGTTESNEAANTEASAPTEPEPDPEPLLEEMDLSARNAFAYRLESDTLYYLQGGWTAPIYPASVTKLFSAYVALQYLNPETVVTAGDELDLVSENSSVAYIHKGNRLTVSMLVEGMLLPSGNDAAHILAAAAARAARGNPELAAEDAIAYFVDMMNTAAQSLGMTGSHFCNPDGYHNEDHYTCVRDLITIARLALENEIISRYARLYEDDVVYASGHTNNWHNTNALINPDSKYYRPEAVGLKTGSTTAAGNCLLSAFSVGGEFIIVGVFGCEEKADRFTDTLQVYQAALNMAEAPETEPGA
ncbi:MAG: D-alanyl-D-alanine carboxypeptidase [Oscillospiraceae bacterium]|nr:D-alanyl-D-alanine carboxypeptidase [Oscillospiraceae bacterium]